MAFESRMPISDVKVFDMIATDILWYHHNCKSPDIEKLLSVRDHLSTLSYNLASISADLKTRYNGSYYIRKIETAKAKQGFMTKGRNMSQSETDSIVSSAEFLKTEIEAEADSYKVDLLLKQVNKILDAMGQRIAFARAEEINSRRQGSNM